VERERLEREIGDAQDEWIETHISWVRLAPHEVWKFKRPVALGFLDFSTLAAREAACHQEVELNRRLAPNVYLGVVPVTENEAGRLQLGGDGPPVDFAVHMRRMPERNRCDRRLLEGRLERDAIVRLADTLASFHADVGPAEAQFSVHGNREAIAANVRENFTQTRGSITKHIAPPQATDLERSQLAFLQNHAEVFAFRLESGRVRDGHGDLRLEHIYLDDEASPPEVTILDCIEFSDRFRFADVAADVGFLAMDLAAHHRVDLAEALLARYSERSDDHDLFAVIDFYESYRATVRAKIAAILANDPKATSASRERAAEQARRHFLLALAAERHSLLKPRLVAFSGTIASGKSTLARALAERLSAPVIESDRTRKALRSVAPTTPLHDPAFAGAYDERATDDVYAELLRRAEVILRSGRPVILDASFRAQKFRAHAAELAGRLGVPFHLVVCEVDPRIARQRLRERQRSPSVSDGRTEIYDVFTASFEPLEVGTELPAAAVIRLDTGQPLAQNLSRLEQTIATWPGGLPG